MLIFCFGECTAYCIDITRRITQGHQNVNIREPKIILLKLNQIDFIN